MSSAEKTILDQLRPLRPGGFCSDFVQPGGFLCGAHPVTPASSSVSAPIVPVRPLFFGLLALVLAGGGCSVNQLAARKLGNALAQGGGVYASDDDPELIRQAAPFSLKLMESLLAEDPHQRGLLGAASSGFTQYAYAFVQQDADEMESRDVQAARALRYRARRLYLRARDYALRGLEEGHPGFTAQLRADPAAAARTLEKPDVSLAYWAASSWGSAIGIVKDNTDLIAELPQVEALIDRALALDETYDHGAIHGFLIIYEMSRPNGAGSPAARARAHFARAVQLTGGKQAGPFVSLAESVSVPEQNRKEFESLLRQALAIDAAAKPEWRLVNLVMQRRARWLLSQVDNLIANENE
jgi:predicted anti-sigma-YlaC factor YlaD